MAIFNSNLYVYQRVNPMVSQHFKQADSIACTVMFFWHLASFRSEKPKSRS